MVVGKKAVVEHGTLLASLSAGSTNKVLVIRYEKWEPKVPICAVWRRERDSNPRYLSVR